MENRSSRSSSPTFALRVPMLPACVDVAPRVVVVRRAIKRRSRCVPGFRRPVRSALASCHDTADVSTRPCRFERIRLQASSDGDRFAGSAQPAITSAPATIRKREEWFSMTPSIGMLGRLRTDRRSRHPKASPVPQRRTANRAPLTVDPHNKGRCSSAGLRTSTQRVEEYSLPAGRRSARRLRTETVRAAFRVHRAPPRQRHVSWIARGPLPAHSTGPGEERKHHASKSSHCRR